MDAPVFGTGRETVTGLDDAFGAGAGINVADTLTWAQDDDGNDGADVPVQLAGGMWVRIDGNGKLHAGPKAIRHTRARARPPTGDASNTWLGLALVGKVPHDIRPDLLALVWQRNLHGVAKLITYGRNCLAAMGFDLADDALEAAAADALLIVAFGKRRGDGTPTAASVVKRKRPYRPTLRDRERQFRLRHGMYAPMRDAAEKIYRRRYREAVTAYAGVDNWRPTRDGRAHTSGFKADPLHRALYSPSRRRLVQWIEAGRLIPANRYSGRGQERYETWPKAA